MPPRDVPCGRLLLTCEFTVGSGGGLLKPEGAVLEYRHSRFCGNNDIFGLKSETISSTAGDRTPCISGRALVFFAQGGNWRNPRLPVGEPVHELSRRAWLTLRV